MRGLCVGVDPLSVSLLVVIALTTSAQGGAIWTDGDGDGLPDSPGTLVAAFGDSVTVDVWIDAQSFAWTNFLAYVEWDGICFEYVSAEYLIAGGSNFPIDRFSHPSAVGFGGFGYTEGGVDRIGRFTLELVAQAACCVTPIIDPKSSYGVFSQLGAESAYFLFTSNPGSCWSPLPGIEACCFPDGTCVEADIGACPAGSTPRGPGTSCADPCPVLPGACCLPGGACTGPLSRDACEAQGGVYAGDGTDCASVSCDTPVGACCFSGDACQDGVPRDTCESSGGTYKGDGTACINGSCPAIPGACCFGIDQCLVLYEDVCADSGGVFLGEGGECLPTTNCPIEWGACCAPAGFCQIRTQEDCEALGFVYQGNATTCSPSLCPDLRGACCLPTGFCRNFEYEDDCVADGGVFYGMGTRCDDFECPQPMVACCFPLTGLCQDMRADSCYIAGGLPRFETSCADTMCPSPRRASCCLPDSGCVPEITQLECEARGGTRWNDRDDCDSPVVCLPECVPGTAMAQIPIPFGEAKESLRKRRGLPARNRERGTPEATATPCLPANSTNGTAANYRWYNLCAGYLWLYDDWCPGEGVGVLFGGAPQPEVNGDNNVKRAITYYRNVAGYGYAVNVFVDVDNEGDGCPDYTIASDLLVEPGLRWNCSEFDVDIPCGVDHLIVRTVHSTSRLPGPIAFATDGPFSEGCDPDSPARSFYYGLGDVCIPWRGPDGDPDNFLYWLVIDLSEPCVTAVEETSWGRIKGLFR